MASICAYLHSNKLDVAIIDDNLRIKSHFTHPITRHNPNHRWYEHSPNECYDVFKQQLKELDIRAPICFTTGLSSTVFLDSHYNPVRNVILEEDQRCLKQVRIMRNRGFNVDTSFLFPSCFWVMQNEPCIWSNVKYVCDYHEYFNYLLTGELISCSANVLARTSINDDIDNISESHEIFRRLALNVENPGYLIKSNTCDLEVVVGCFDVFATMIGANVHEAESLTIITDSTHGWVASTNRYNNDISNTLGPYKDVFATGFNIYEGAYCGNFILEHIMHLYGVNTYSEIEDMIQKVPIGCEKLYYRRSSGSYIGIDVHHQKEHFIRAFIEGNVYETYNSLSNFPITIQHVTITGKYANIRGLVQMYADILNKQIIVPRDSENIQLIGCAKLCFKTNVFVEGCIYTPNHSNHLKYINHFKLWMKSI